MASSPKRPDSPHIRRKSWPSQPRSILKKRPESPKTGLSVEETESGLGQSITTNSQSDSNERPNNSDQIQGEPTSSGSHYSKSQLFLSKNSIMTNPTFSRVFHPKLFDNFSREIKVVKS